MRIRAAHLLACLIVLSPVEAAWAQASDLRLIEAVKRQDRAAVARLLEGRADANARQPDGATALHWAAHRDDLESADLLIRAGAAVNAANELGVTPLSLACTNGSGPMVGRLLAAGANPNAVLSTGESPLMAAARTGALDAVRALIAQGAEVNHRESTRDQTALMWAVAQRHPSIVRVLVEHGADVHARSAVRHRAAQMGSRFIQNDDFRDVISLEQGGFTPLLFAARSGDLESARLLLDAGARVDDAAPDGNPVLVVAAHSGHGAVAALLLARGANANTAGAGYAALHAAVLRGDRELVRALLAHGAQPDVPLTKGTPVRRYSADYALSAALAGATPLWLAARYGETDIMRMLAAAGADPRFAMPDGTNTLLAAVAASGGIGSGDRRERYLSPVDIAARIEGEDERITLETVTLAVALGAHVNAVNQAGDTAVHAAASKGLLAVIEFLAASGAPLDVKNKRGLTPLAVASVRPRGEFVTQTDAARQATIDLLRRLGARE